MGSILEACVKPAGLQDREIPQVRAVEVLVLCCPPGEEYPARLSIVELRAFEGGVRLSSRAYNSTVDAPTREQVIAKVYAAWSGR